MNDLQEKSTMELLEKLYISQDPKVILQLLKRLVKFISNSILLIIGIPLVVILLISIPYFAIFMGIGLLAISCDD